MKPSLSSAGLLFAFGLLLVDTAFALSTSTSTATRKRSVFKNLDESKVRHPLDHDLTSYVRRLPLSELGEQAIRRTLSIVEQGLRLDLLSTAVKVSPDQLPHIHSLLQEACDILDLEGNPPNLYVQSNVQANAYTLALRGRDENSTPIVVMTSALLERCTDDEIQAIIGHELGHLKFEHSLYLTLGNIASTPLRNLPFIGSSTERLLQRWRLAAEYSCDRAALLVAQDLTIVNGAMLKLVGGTSKIMNTEAFAAQCQEYDELLGSVNPLVRVSTQMQLQRRTHPLPVRRVTELEKWAKSDNYLSILESGTQQFVENEEDGKEGEDEKKEKFE